MEAPKGTVAPSHYPPVGKLWMWLLRETDVTDMLLDESIRGQPKFCKSSRMNAYRNVCIQENERKK